MHKAYTVVVIYSFQPTLYMADKSSVICLSNLHWRHNMYWSKSWSWMIDWHPFRSMPIIWTGLYIRTNHVCNLQHESWWRHKMETFSALLAICAGNSPVTGEFPAQRPATRSFDVFFELWLNKRLSKQLWGWWFETPSRPLWRHCNVDSWNDGIHIPKCKYAYVHSNNSTCKYLSQYKSIFEYYVFMVYPTIIHKVISAGNSETKFYYCPFIVWYMRIQICSYVFIVHICVTKLSHHRFR